MNISNYYWYFKSALTPKFCDDVIEHGLKTKESLALTGDYGNKKKLNQEEIKDIKRKRNSNVSWLNENWIYKEIHPYIHKANRDAGWNFNWDRSEKCQFTKYKKDQYYDWHCDSWNKPYKENKNGSGGKIRKLSVTCQLTDGSEYKGGELEFDFRNYDPHKREETRHVKKATEILSKGSIIVFPSFVWHRVKPVLEGTRYSLVLWNLGYPYK